MNGKKLPVLLALLTIATFTGCQFMADLWPTSIPKDVKRYTDTDPNTLKITDFTLGKLKSLKEEAITRHIETQTDLKHEMSRDANLYQRAIEQAVFNIQQAENERTMWIGTIDKPGILTSLLIGSTGLAAYFAGSKQPRPIDYTTAEVQAIVDKVKAGKEVIIG